MNTRYSFIALGVLALVGAGTATAGGGADESLITLDFTAAGREVYYLAHDASIWQEANGMEGLQSTNVMHMTRVVEPDAALLLA